MTAAIATAGRPRVLIVDDEVQVTRSLKLILRKQYAVETASSGAEAIDRISALPEFDVVVSDMRMPGMNGAEFLREARNMSPDSVRILLTGQTDSESAMLAVNEGQIFRFMSKPCSPAALRGVLDEALAHRAARVLEQDILQRTLRSLGLVLSDVIGTIHPVAAHRSEKLRAIVTALAPGIGIEEPWRIELAAALSHLGCVALPARLIEAAMRGESLSSADAEAWVGQAKCGASLLDNVPRLEWVADMIRGHAEPTEEFCNGVPFADWPEVTKSAELLRTANAYLTNLASTRDRQRALDTMAGWELYAQEFLELLAELPEEASSGREVTLRADRLNEGMVLVDDLKSREGLVLCCAGAVVTETLCKLAVNFSIRGELREPIRVRLDEAPDGEGSDQ